jgi:hypothetical protein
MTNQNKQTAVEWLVDQLEKHYVLQDIKNTTAFLQSKEMEKEQIESAYWEGGQDVPMSGKQCELYYNETYGGNK